MKRTLTIIAATLLMAAVLPTHVQAASYGSIGSKVEAGNADFVPTLQALPAGVVAEVLQRDIGAMGDDSDDAYYLHFAATGATAIAVGSSYRLTCGVVFTTTCPTNAKEGTWVTAGEPDISSPAATNLGAFAPMVRYLESDGKPGWTPGDGLYVDLGATAGTLEGGITPDIRLVKPSAISCTTCGAGRLVKTGDADLTEAGDGDRVPPLTAAFAPGAFTLRWFDGDGDFAVGTSDVFYLKGPAAPSLAANTVHPDVGDARLGELALNPFTSTVDAFTLVSSGSPDHARTFDVITPQIAVTNTADAVLTNQHLFVHFDDPDGADDHLLVGDLFLYRGPSGGSGGTLITAKGTSATAPGHGTGIDTAADLTARLRYYDLSPSGFSANDPIIVKRPGNAAAAIEIGDFRITSSLSHAAGTQVKSGDSDVNQPLVTDANLVVKRFDADGASWTVLKALSNAKILENAVGTGTAGRWDPANDALYISSAATVSNGNIRLFHPTGALNQGPTATVTCPGDADCGAAIVAHNKIAVTGADSTYDAGSSEYIYDSEDLILGPGDQRVIAHPAGVAGSTVAAADADAAARPLASGDVVLVSYDPACATTCTAFMRIGDVFLYGSTFGSRVTASTTGFKPILTELAAGAIDLVRFNRGDQTSPSDDTFYGTFTNAVALQAADIRFTANPPAAAGTLLKTGDTNYAQEAAGSAQFTRDPSGLETLLCHVDVDSRAGVSRADPVYIQVDNAVFGAPFNADLTRVNAYDLRVTQYPASGTAIHSGGSIVLGGDSDLSSGQTTCGAAPGTTSWRLRYFDQNGNGRFDSAGTSTTDDDVLYAMLQTSQNQAPPTLFAVRMTGAGGSTTPGGGGAPPGGGGVPPGTTTTGATTTTASTTTTGTGTDPPTGDLATITQANANLATSLEVSREGADNLLSWDAQTGVDGYQVWRATSPFALIATLTEGQTSYTDQGGPEHATYVVTAFIGETGRFTDINNETVPGNEDLSGADVGDGASTGTGTKGGSTPGIGLVAIIGLLGIAVLVRRRF